MVAPITAIVGGIIMGRLFKKKNATFCRLSEPAPTTKSAMLCQGKNISQE